MTTRSINWHYITYRLSGDNCVDWSQLSLLLIVVKVIKADVCDTWLSLLSDDSLSCPLCAAAATRYNIIINSFPVVHFLSDTLAASARTVEAGLNCGLNRCWQKLANPASLWSNFIAAALRCGTRCQGITQFYLPPMHSSANGTKHICLLIRSWSSFTNTGRLKRGPVLIMVHVVSRISQKLSDIDVQLLGNSNRNLGFPIQNLPPDSRLEVRFRHFGCFRVAFSNKPYRKDGTTPGTVAGELSSRPITDDTLFLVFFCCFIALYFTISWQVEKYARPLTRPQLTGDSSPVVVEEYMSETERRDGRVNMSRLVIMQRLSDESYLGTLYVDRDFKDSDPKGNACRFVLMLSN